MTGIVYVLPYTFLLHFYLQENLNFCGEPYSLPTQNAIRQLSEKDISFEIVSALLGYFRTLNTPGAILVFLPGWNTIFTLLRYLTMDPVFGKGSSRIVCRNSRQSKEVFIIFVIPCHMQ